MARGVLFALGSEHDLLDDLRANPRYAHENWQFVSVKRIVSATTKRPTPLVRIQVSFALLAKKLITDGVIMGYSHFKAEPIIQRSEPQQCRRCQQWSNHDARTCKGPRICLRCSGRHGVDACTTERKKPTCANCGGNHAAVYKGCPAYKNACEKQQTTVIYGLRLTLTPFAQKLHH